LKKKTTTYDGGPPVDKLVAAQAFQGALVKPPVLPVVVYHFLPGGVLAAALLVFHCASSSIYMQEWARLIVKENHRFYRWSFI
jgi:hypothetical protein